MATANTADFLGEGTTTGAFAPTQTPEQIAEAQRQAIIRRQRQIALDAQTTAQNNETMRAEERARQPEQARQEMITRNSSAGEAGNDWLYPGIVAGTIGAGILGAGLVGAAGAGGAAAGGIAPTAATAGAANSAAAATAAAQAAAAGGVVAPGAGIGAGLGAGAGTAGAAGVLGGAAAAAAPAAAAFGLKDALSLAPLALDVGGIIASQIRTKAENDLLAKQKELAAAAKARQVQVQQEGMNRLGQQMLAFAPLNRAMQEMYGQGAGYSPDQMGAMTADPGAQQAPLNEQERIRRNADLERQQQVSGAFAPAQGPAPLQQRAPMPARRF